MNRPALFHLSAISLTASVIAALTLASCSAANPGASLPSSGTLLPSAASTTSGTPSATATDSENLPPFACTLPVHLAATTPRAQITDIRVAEHDAYDRLVFDFASGLPEVTLEAAQPPLTQDPSGLAVAVEGTSYLRLVLHGGTTQLPSGGSSYSGSTSFLPRFNKLIDVRSAGDFEAVASWYVGLNGSAPCVRVLILTSPDRLVIDLQH